MSSTPGVPTRHRASIEWSATDGVQPLVFVARIDGRPVAVLEMRPDKRFRLTTTSGVDLGEFPHSDAAHDAFQAWIDAQG